MFAYILFRLGGARSPTDTSRLYFYVIYRTDSTNSETYPILLPTPVSSGHALQQGSSFLQECFEAWDISSFIILQYMITHAVTVLPPAFLLLIIPEPNDLFYAIVRAYTYVTVFWPNLAFSVLLLFILSAQQIRDVCFARKGQGLSPWFLSLQCLNLAAVGILQLTRPEKHVSDNYYDTTSEWFIERGSVPVLYFVMAVVFAFSRVLQVVRSRQLPVDSRDLDGESSRV